MAVSGFLPVSRRGYPQAKLRFSFFQRCFLYLAGRFYAVLDPFSVGAGIGRAVFVPNWVQSGVLEGALRRDFLPNS